MKSSANTLRRAALAPRARGLASGKEIMFGTEGRVRLRRVPPHAAIADSAPRPYTTQKKAVFHPRRR